MKPWMVSNPRRIEIVCLGILAVTLPFSGCALKRSGESSAAALSSLGSLAGARRDASVAPPYASRPAQSENAAAALQEVPRALVPQAAQIADRSEPAPPAPVPAQSPTLQVRDLATATAIPDAPQPTAQPVASRPSAQQPPNPWQEPAQLTAFATSKPRAAGVQHANAGSFDQQVLRSEVPVLVDFYASWCGPCKRLAPTLDEVAAESQHAKVVKVDIDANPELAARYGVQSIPNLMVFKEGRVVASEKGLVSKAKLKTMLGD